MVAFNHVSITVPEKELFSGFTFSLPKGGRVCFTGPSGSGKTSVFRAMLGLMAFEGEISVDGLTVAPENLKAIRRRVAYLSQTPFLGGQTLRESLLLPFTFESNRANAPGSAAIERALVAVGLDPSRLASPASALSGGERQKLTLARAILMDRPIWLLDEITSALDSDSREAVLNLLADTPATLLSISHDAAFIDRQPTLFTLRDCRFIQMR